jgi:hypothetical protein
MRFLPPILEVASCTRAGAVVQATPAQHIFSVGYGVLSQSLNPQFNPHLWEFTAPKAERLPAR